jgi:hypothetical protein
MKTGQPHPLAACPILTLLQQFEDENTSYDLQILGDLVAILCIPFSTEIFELAIWNWKSGSLLLVSHQTSSVLRLLIMNI